MYIFLENVNVYIIVIFFFILDILYLKYVFLFCDKDCLKDFDKFLGLFLFYFLKVEGKYVFVEVREFVLGKIKLIDFCVIVMG